MLFFTPNLMCQIFFLIQTTCTKSLEVISQKLQIFFYCTTFGGDFSVFDSIEKQRNDHQKLDNRKKSKKCDYQLFFARFLYQKLQHIKFEEKKVFIQILKLMIQPLKNAGLLFYLSPSMQKNYLIIVYTISIQEYIAYMVKRKKLGIFSN